MTADFAFYSTRKKQSGPHMASP